MTKSGEKKFNETLQNLLKTPPKPRDPKAAPKSARKRKAAKGKPATQG